MANSWKKVSVVFKLKSPLHIGYLPSKGSVVSHTRYYIPGRNFWGAITKRITEHLFENPTADNYKDIGRQIIENFRFSYFYIYDGETIYFPKYTDEGVKYGDDKKSVTKAEFEHKFISSQISTAIDSESLTARDESLHEIEFINNKFIDKDGNLRNIKIAGCFWIKDGSKVGGKEVKINSVISIDNFNIIQELIVGGESKYGFGHILFESINEIKFPFVSFNWETPDEIQINKDEFLVGHLKYEKNIKFTGDIELLSGRGYYDPKKSEDNTSDRPGQIISIAEYYLSPGTRIISKSENCKLNWDGTLEIKNR